MVVVDVKQISNSDNAEYVRFHDLRTKCRSCCENQGHVRLHTNVECCARLAASVCFHPACTTSCLLQTTTQCWKMVKIILCNADQQSWDFSLLIKVASHPCSHLVHHWASHLYGIGNTA
jgi:hypothetical protein